MVPNLSDLNPHLLRCQSYAHLATASIPPSHFHCPDVPDIPVVGTITVCNRDRAQDRLIRPTGCAVYWSSLTHSTSCIPSLAVEACLQSTSTPSLSGLNTACQSCHRWKFACYQRFNGLPVGSNSPILWWLVIARASRYISHSFIAVIALSEPMNLRSIL